MKASVAIALLALGTLLLVTPLVLDFLDAMMEQTTSSQSEENRIVIHGRTDRVYRLTCLGVGVVMILLAVAGSFDARRSEREKPTVEEEKEQDRLMYF